VRNAVEKCISPQFDRIYTVFMHVSLFAKHFVTSAKIGIEFL